VLFLFVLVIVIENPDGEIHDETDHTKNIVLRIHDRITHINVLC
jgi:hypothetical protein